MELYQLKITVGAIHELPLLFNRHYGRSAGVYKDSKSN